MSESELVVADVGVRLLGSVAGLESVAGVGVVISESVLAPIAGDMVRLLVAGVGVRLLRLVLASIAGDSVRLFIAGVGVRLLVVSRLVLASIAGSGVRLLFASVDVRLPEPIAMRLQVMTVV
jgi:hypothetical protein